MNNKIFIFIIGVLVIGFIAFALTRGTITDDKTTSTELNSSGVENGSINVYGNPDAEVVLIELYSFACPTCASFHPILKEIREEYKDHIKFQVVHFPLTASFGSSARIPHRAAETAALQGSDKFWELHDILFENQVEWRDAEEPYEKILEYVAEIGLDVEQFETDYASSQINTRINNDIDYYDDRADATPTFYLNGERIENIDLSSPEIARDTLNKALGIESLDEEVDSNASTEEDADEDSENQTEQPAESEN